MVWIWDQGRQRQRTLGARRGEARRGDAAAFHLPVWQKGLSSIQRFVWVCVGGGGTARATGRVAVMDMGGRAGRKRK